MSYDQRDLILLTLLVASVFMLGFVIGLRP